jgi:hypothetical protein
LPVAKPGAGLGKILVGAENGEESPARRTPYPAAMDPR